LSATSVVPRCIIGIETIYSHEKLLNYGAILTIKNYIGLNLPTIINNENFHIHLLKEMINKSLVLFDIKNIEINSNKLKGGFISDVIQVDIITKDEIHISSVLKMENKNETFLSTMSNHLDLYNREYYFYDVISKYVPIKYPKSYGLIKNENFDTVRLLSSRVA
jgi:hypothetical protein